MKISKYILGSFLAITASASFTSCSDSFLDEEYKRGYQSPYLETEQGVFDLATSLYANLRFWFAYDWAHATTQIGVDEFSIGTDNSNETWNIYDSRLGPSVVTQMVTQQQLKPFGTKCIMVFHLPIRSLLMQISLPIQINITWYWAKDIFSVDTTIIDCALNMVLLF